MLMRFLLSLVAFGALVLGQPIDPARLDLVHVKAERADYKGSPAVKVTETHSGDALAVVKGSTFHNGVIDVDVAGTVGKDAPEGSRGFIGLAFRVQTGAGKYEAFYIRPTNGRSTDQLRRNHSTQYISTPDWPWERLRKESPGAYESYADMLEGEWTHLRIVVKGTNAELYVGGAAQPTLVIHDLKQGDVSGGVALWVGPGTVGYFKDLKIQ